MAYLDIYNLESTGGSIKETISRLATFQNIVYLALTIMVIIMISYAVAYHCCEEEKKPEPATATTQAVTSAPTPEPAPAPAPETKSAFESEPFTNDLPYQLKKEIITLSENDEYSDVLQKMALDQDVVKQHNTYVNERNKITSTASFSPMRSDNQDIVTTVGLTKPSFVKVDESARQVPSSTPEQQSAPVQLFWR
jgi:hypothetical protein